MSRPTLASHIVNAPPDAELVEIDTVDNGFHRLFWFRVPLGRRTAIRIRFLGPYIEPDDEARK